MHRFPKPESLCISFPEDEQQKFWGSYVDFCYCRPTSWTRCCACQKDFHWSMRMARIDLTHFHNDNQYVLSLNWNTSTIQKSNTSIKTAVTTTRILVQKQSYFWHRNFPHSFRTQSPVTRQKINVGQMSHWDSFGCVIFKICATMAQKRSLCRTLLYLHTVCYYSPLKILSVLSINSEGLWDILEELGTNTQHH